MCTIIMSSYCKTLKKLRTCKANLYKFLLFLCFIGMQRSEEFFITKSHFIRLTVSSHTQTQKILVSCPKVTV